jgi:hypothetical protein
MLSRVPQGSLAWDPDYPECLRWLARSAPRGNAGLGCQLVAKGGLLR